MHVSWRICSPQIYDGYVFLPIRAIEMIIGWRKQAMTDKVSGNDSFEKKILIISLNNFWKAVLAIYITWGLEQKECEVSELELHTPLYWRTVLTPIYIHKC